MIGGMDNVVIFKKNCSWQAQKAKLAASPAPFCVFWVRLCSAYCRIGRVLTMTFYVFSVNFCQMLDSYFAWQAQYLVRLKGDATFCGRYTS